jgi:NIMA-interacting peptidyl-prolyl cis-trans isomerase 1
MTSVTKRTGEPIGQEQDPELPPNWVPLLTPDGQVYYYNVKSRASRWVPPAKVPEPQQIRASHILVKHKEVKNPFSKGQDKAGQPVDKEFDEALKIAEELHTMVMRDPKVFSEVAKANSDCNSWERGGDLGRFVRHKMHKEFSDAAFELDVGEISGVVVSPSGLHIVLRTE